MSESDLEKAVKEISKDLDTLTTLKEKIDAVIVKPKSSNKREVWWILWGILIAFGLQVLYDGIGEFPNYTPKFWGGLGIEITSYVLLFVYAWKIRKSEKQK